MGYDKVTIASMNSARKGLHSLPREARGSYLDRLLNGIQPDIGILPGDNIGKTALLQAYGQYLSPDNEGTLMVYDVNKIDMKKQCLSDNIFNDLWGLDPTKIAWPEVQVSSLQPVREVVKTFTTVSFHYQLFSLTDQRNNERLMESLALLAQRIAIVTGNPILIAGEIRLSLEAVRNVLSRLNSRTQQAFLEDANAFLSKLGYLPSMVKGSTRDKRQLFKLNTVQCSRKDSVVKTWSQEENADCFIASQALEMSEAKGIEIEQVLGQTVKMSALKNTCVTKTEMQIPVRPPRHHGG